MLYEANRGTATPTDSERSSQVSLLTRIAVGAFFRFNSDHVGLEENRIELALAKDTCGEALSRVTFLAQELNKKSCFSTHYASASLTSLGKEALSAQRIEEIHPRPSSLAFVSSLSKSS